MGKLINKVIAKFKNESDYLKDKNHLAAYNLGLLYLKDEYHNNGMQSIALELKKRPFRFDIINFILTTFKRPTVYLEVGVRYPEENFDKILADTKYSVDPGVENVKNPVDFKLTSDEFFEKIRDQNILKKDVKFDVIFIDGLHLAEQVEKDIKNSLDFLNEDGFIVLHDCNPPTEFHASENYHYRLSPSKGYWNGTTWKAFFKYRQEFGIYSCCIDSDWGIGVISKKVNLGQTTKVKNPYYEYNVFKENREESLNLISFNDFKMIIK